MALSINDPEADRLARVGEPRGCALRSQLLEIARRCAALPVQDGRSDDEIVGYDRDGVPR